MALLEAQQDALREVAMMLQPDTWNRKFHNPLVTDPDDLTVPPPLPQVTIAGDQMMLLDRLLNLIQQME
jgi:hypothetical protein